MKAGVDDRCANESCPGAAGYYCAGDGVAGCPNSLYYCSGGIVKFSQRCPTRCVFAGTGVDDYCQ
jgi:hypothetical protein